MIKKKTSQLRFAKMQNFARPPQINESILRQVVEKSTGSFIPGPITWKTEPIDHPRLNLLTTGLYRISCQELDGANIPTWSVILKIIALNLPDPASPFNSSDDPTHWNYWKRELLAYQSSWLRPENDSLAIPQCWAVDESHPNEIQMWLEDITGTLAPQWPLHRPE